MVTLGEAFTKHDVLWAVKPSTQLGFRADLNINDIGETHDSPVKLGFILYSVQYIYMYINCIALHYIIITIFITLHIYIYVHAYKTWHYITAHCITLFNYIITLHYVTLHTLHYIHYIHIYTHTYIIYIAQPRKTQKTLTHIYIYINIPTLSRNKKLVVYIRFVSCYRFSGETQSYILLIKPHNKGILY